ncbi:MAG TPA: hemerythrin domain-containing protein [Ktedonobacterales bacterium]|nr:hemerythrin domain-containing protein [Ktedonobacterales bacterium]
MDVLTRLSHEHDDLRVLLAPIKAAAEARDAPALAACLGAARAALTDDLDSHIATEEAKVFSAIAGTLGDGLVATFYDEHAEIRAIRDEIYTRLARDEAPFEPSLRLCELIQEHQEREDLMLFPSAREMVE